MTFILGQSGSGGGGGSGGTVTQGPGTIASPWYFTLIQGGNTGIITAAGALKVDGSGVEQPTEDAADNLIGNPIGTDAIQIGFKDGSGNTQIPSAATPLPVTFAGTSVVLGNLTNNNAAPAATNIGSLVALANAASPTWIEGDQVLISVDISGNQRVKINAALPAGTNVIGHVIVDSGAITVSGTIAAAQSGLWNVNQSIGVAGFEKITDGTNTAVVKAASTAAVATDPSLVVALSPNSPLPAGANVLGVVSTKTPLTISAPTASSVGVVSAQIVAANANRKGLVLINTSSNTISLGFGSAAVLNSGVTLTPFGVFEMDEFLYSTAAVNAIASTASSNIAIQELTT